MLDGWTEELRGCVVHIIQRSDGTHYGLNIQVELNLRIGIYVSITV